MNSVAPPVLPEPVPTVERTLRRLFLTLFLRGRGSRGLKKSTAPTSIANKLALTLLFYALFGCMALFFVNQDTFALSIYLSGMTFAFLGMFVASSAGEILFNKEEGDILLHRPVTPRMLLWTKVRVLVEVSLWLAGAFNLAGLVGGTFFGHGNWLFLPVHIVSVVLEALLCTGSVVLVYQLCLRWFGRERLDGLMTTAQVGMTIMVVLSGQILPRVMFKLDHILKPNEGAWWISLLPPAWFAGFDDAFAGSGASHSWLLAGLAVAMTAVVLWLAFGRLAGVYGAGLQALNESVSGGSKAARRRRWLPALVQLPPLCWWNRHPVARASFVLTSAYMLRDRDVKLRLYPGLAPMLIFPFIVIFQGRGQGGGGMGDFGVGLAGAYLGLVPLLGMGILQYSQQWQATDVFRSAPITGPAQVCHGARRAVLFFLTFPLLLVFAALAYFLGRDWSQLELLLPGIIVLPVYALVPSCLDGAVPLSKPTEAAKSAGRGLWTMGVMFISMALGGLAAYAHHQGWFWPMMAGEFTLALLVYVALRHSLSLLKWESAE